MMMNGTCPELLYIFGTGHAAVTRCYNTCFAIRCGGEYFMTDAGGGNTILRILQDMDVDLCRIHHLFVTHSHTDHILGVIWMIRFIGTRLLSGSYEGDFNIYCHKDLVPVIETICQMTLMEKLCRLIGSRIRLNVVTNGQTLSILEHPVTFFDIHSTKLKQYGFTFTLSNGKNLVCCGDEPFHPACEAYAKNSSWMLHEAFCLYEDRERFQPYEKHHSTVKDACALAERMGIEHLLLYHTEDTDLAHRKKRYHAEGKTFYRGSLFVPDDKEILSLV